MDTSAVVWSVVGLIAVTLVMYVIVIYNRLVAIKHNVSKAWSNIEVLLKQRHDELPKLVEVCKQYMKFEQETLEKVMQARSQVFSASQQQNMGALGQAETGLRMGLGNLFAVAENYPELKANTNFMHLHDRISSLESSIADRREYYNESVNINNVRIEQFPDVMVANWFGFKPFDLLEFGEQEIADVDLKSAFNS